MVGLVEFFTSTCHTVILALKDPQGLEHREMQKEVIKNIDIKQLKIKIHFSKRKNGAYVY
ncbi:MAG TPA: hypothetical protein VEH06_10535 [Candidatus Bathyarchaeia archaeon]|nr:hypothetical protein [Candidatus Bathyarchaeia archaeon]